MEELQLVLTPSRVDQRNQGIMLANWRVGQTINALVRDRLPSGSLILTVGGHSFVSSTDIPVQPGDKIALEVKQIEPTLLFRLTSSIGLEPKSASTTHRWDLKTTCWHRYGCAFGFFGNPDRIRPHFFINKRSRSESSASTML